MLNQLVLLGRIDTINDNNIIINNSDILYTITFNGNDIINNVKEYCKHGDLVGVKAKLGKDNVIIADKITFLSSKNQNV